MALPQWHAELSQPQVSHIAAVGAQADVFFVTGFVDEWRSHGLNAAFLPAAGAREIVPIAPLTSQHATVAFIGAGYDATRAEFLLALSQAVDTRVYGPGWEQWRAELAWNGGEVSGAAFARAWRAIPGNLPIHAARLQSDEFWRAPGQ